MMDPSTRVQSEAMWRAIKREIIEEAKKEVLASLPNAFRGGKLSAGYIGGTVPTGSIPDLSASTVTPGTAWGGTASAGTATTYSRGDHSHGTPAEPIGGGAALWVAEVDGSPAVGTVSYIKVTNGKLTNDGGGTVTLDLTGGTGGGAGESAGTLVQTYAPASISNGGVATLGQAPAQGNILLAFVCSNQFQVTSITQTNVTWTRVSNVAYQTGDWAVASVWKGVVGASAGTAVTVNFGGNNAQAITIHEYSGAVNVDALSRSWGGSGDLAQTSLAWFEGGGRAIAFVQTRAGSPTVNPTAKWSAYASMPYNTGFGYMTAAYYDASAASTNVAAFAEETGHSNNWALFLIHIAP